MPDYFVPLDTTRYSDYHRQLVAKGAVIQTNLKYVDAHRKQLKEKYNSFDSFYKNFTVPEEMMKQLVKSGEESGVKYNEKEFNSSKKMLEVQLKGLVARDLWDMSEYFQIINEEDPSIQKALELIQRNDFDKLGTKAK